MNKTYKIKQVMRERGLRQYAVAKEMGMKPQNLSHVLKAETVSDDMLCRIVKAINALTRYQQPVTERDLQTNEATITCPKCGETITIKVE